jgi:beta-lactamase superfamily II metal-dependent hydrolase
LTNILNATPAIQIFDGGWNVSNGSYQDVLNKTVEDQITRTIVTGGQSIDFTEKVKVDIISPDTITGDLNHDTLIPLITYGDVKFLLLGTEQIIEHPVQAQILRVADHGSRGGTDPGFIRTLNPEIAIVSTGSGNPSDNPASTTLNILQTAGAEVLRTDLDGTITISTDGSSYSVSKLRMEPEITLSLVSVVETRAPG